MNIPNLSSAQSMATPGATPPSSFDPELLRQYALRKEIYSKAKLRNERIVRISALFIAILCGLCFWATDAIMVPVVVSIVLVIVIKISSTKIIGDATKKQAMTEIGPGQLASLDAIDRQVAIVCKKTGKRLGKHTRFSSFACYASDWVAKELLFLQLCFAHAKKNSDDYHDMRAQFVIRYGFLMDAVCKAPAFFKVQPMPPAWKAWIDGKNLSARAGTALDPVEAHG
jgi:hypothetical protein